MTQFQTVPTEWVDEDGVVQELPVPEPSDLEERARIDSLEELQTRRRMILENNTRLFALHGAFGLFDDYRKKMVEAQKIAARQALGATDTKVTESRIDAEAYGGEAYGKFMDTALEEKIAYLKLSTEVLEIEEAIRSREIELRAYIAESSLR
jgi:hypothetical protein